MIMQMQQLPRLQDIMGRADHLLYEEDEGFALAASCVPAQRMRAVGCKTKVPHKQDTHCDNNLHTQPTQLRSTHTGNLCTHDSHPHCESLHTLSAIHPQYSNNLHTPFAHSVDSFTPLGTLGRGNMGTVLLVLSKHSPHAPFALKITHSLSSKKQRSHVEREILSSLHHPFLQTLHAHFESGPHSLLLLDFCSGGDLNLLRHRQPEKRFSETAARFYAAEVLAALEHLHKLDIVYRDLKPENILLQDSGHIKLTDFDLSLKLGVGWKASTHASATPPICTLRQQIEAEAATHLQLQAGKQSLQCTGFACLRGYALHRSKVAAQGAFRNQKEDDEGCACGILPGGEVGLRGRKQRGPGDYGLKCVYCGKIEAAGDSKTAKKVANEGCSIIKRKKCVGGKEARKVQKWTKGRARMACLPCMKSKEKRSAEEKSVCVVGTDEYVAPEVLRGEEHGFSMDWWSFGILLYEMIYGYTPFKGPTTEDTLRNILEKDPEFPGTKTPAKNLIAQLLLKDPSARLGALGAQDIKCHPYFHGLHWESLPHIYRPPFIPSPLCLSELEERCSAKLKAKRDSHNEHRLSNTCKSWLDEVVESLEAAENSSQNSHTSSSAGFVSSSADDAADRELRRDDDDIDAVSSSAEWSSELDVCMHRAAT